MQQSHKATAAAFVGLGAVVLFGTPALAAADQSIGNAGVSVQLAHMDEEQGHRWKDEPHSKGMMGHHMRGRGMMHPHHHDHGMMGPGMMGPRMMRPGMMAPGRHGLITPYFGHRITPPKDLTTDDVRHFLQHRLEMHGNERLKVGEVKEVDGDTIVAEITTVDDSLVQRLKVDRHSGRMQQAE